MAVVFISPKQRQKTFFIGITAIFLLFLVIISLGIFTSGPKEVSSSLVFNKPKVDIDMKFFDSDQFKNLQTFTQMEKQYVYTFMDKNNAKQTGYISAVSEADAGTILKGMGINTSNIKEAETGRDNPFTPYYSTAVPTKTAKTTTTKK